MAPVSLNGDDFFLPTPQTSSSSSSPYSGADGVRPRTPELGDAPPPPPAEISVPAAFGPASPLPEVEVEIEVEIEGPYVVPVHPTMVRGIKQGLRASDVRSEKRKREIYQKQRRRASEGPPRLASIVDSHGAVRGRSSSPRPS